MAQYTVIGRHSVAGVEQGGVVELDPEEAGWLIEAGHLAVIATPRSKAKAPAAADVPEQSDSDSDKGGE